MEEPPPAAMVAVLTDDVLLRFILKRLSPMDLVRAALASHRWCAVAALAVPRAPPLLGYFFCQEKIESPLPVASAEFLASFIPSDDSSPRLSLALAPEDSLGLSIHDVHLGLVLLLSCKRPDTLLPRILVLDPASSLRTLLPPPPHDALPNDQWNHTRGVIGAAVLAREHPSKLAFQAVCVTLDDDRPRAWVAFVNDSDCVWRALPQSKQTKVVRFDFDPDPNTFGKNCVHAEGKIYWRICKSGRLLALDACTLDFYLLAAPNDLGRHLNKYGNGEMETAEDGHGMTSAEKLAKLDMNSDRCSFPYLLCWPPAFLDTIEKQDNTWTKNIMNLVRIALHNISYIRRLFGEEFFCDVAIHPSDLQIKRLVPIDDESQRFMEWVEKGVHDALQKKFLRSIHFSTYEESGPLIEEYYLTFSYNMDIAMDLRMRGCVDSIWKLTSHAAERTSKQIWSLACEMVHKLVSLISNWGKIPDERVIMMKLLYFDDVTPIDYEPPFFQCYDDTRKQATSKETSIDMAYGVKSVLGNASYHAMKDPPSDLDDDISRGYLYCITKKKVTFYFDSGASRHMSGDKAIIKNLQRVAKKDWITVYTADKTTICLDRAGHVQHGDITLSPVFYMEGLRFNIISVGQLDDGKNLIYLGDNRITVLNKETGSVVGEGMLHATNNKYIARNINSSHELNPGKKRMRAMQAGNSEAEHSEKDVPFGEQQTESEKKLLWTIDCFCENHMTGNKDLLCNTKPVKKSFVTPTGEIVATEQGDVNTDVVVLLGVLYCPGLSANIISEGQLDREGYSFTRSARRCKIRHRESDKIVGLADRDESFMYRVKKFHPIDNPYSKRSRKDESVGSSSKRPKKK